MTRKEGRRTKTLGAKPRHDPIFRKEVSKRLCEKMAGFRSQGMSEASAARQLGVSPQAFNQYLKGKATPKAHVLARACTLWGLRLKYRETEFGSEAFEGQHGDSVNSSAQLSLFSEPQAITNGNLTLKVGARRADTLNISLEIRFAG